MSSSWCVCTERLLKLKYESSGRLPPPPSTNIHTLSKKEKLPLRYSDIVDLTFSGDEKICFTEIMRKFR